MNMINLQKLETRTFLKNGNFKETHHTSNISLNADSIVSVRPVPSDIRELNGEPFVQSLTEVTYSSADTTSTILVVGEYSQIVKNIEHSGDKRVLLNG